MSAGRPLEKFDLPEGWQIEVLQLYKQGASDVEVKAYIYEIRGTFSNDLWVRWMDQEIEFSETIKNGRILRGLNIRKPTNSKLIEKLEIRRKNRKSEYKGENKIIQSLRSMLNYHTKNKGGKFNKKTFNLLGYSKQEYIQHIENSLKDGMSFDNYGLWHIDHIKPVSKFNLTDENELRKCWSLSNLNPLWAFDNLSKGSRL